MSQENAEAVRGVYESWSNGDFQAGRDLFDPLALLVLRVGFPEAGTYLGVEKIVEYTIGFLEPWTRIAIEAEDITEAGESVVVAVRQRGVGRTSGAATEFRYFQVWSFRGRKVIRLENFRERSEVLEALGLSEPDDIELARAGYEAWSRGDLEAILATLDKDIEFWTSGLFPGLEPVYRGHEGMRKFWEDFRGPWKSLRIAISHFRQRGDQIVALGTFEAVARDGLTVHREAANVLTMRNGLAIRINAYASWNAALEAAGLSEQTPPGSTG